MRENVYVTIAVFIVSIAVTGFFHLMTFLFPALGGFPMVVYAIMPIIAVFCSLVAMALVKLMFKPW